MSFFYQKKKEKKENATFFPFTRKKNCLEGLGTYFSTCCKQNESIKIKTKQRKRRNKKNTRFTSEIHNSAAEAVTR